MNNKEHFTFNQNNIFDLWVFENIENLDGADKTDECYLELIGCTVVILLIATGKPLCWSYITDSDGGVKEGVGKSGLLRDFYYNIDIETLCAYSQYNRYTLKKLPQKFGELYWDRSISIPNFYTYCLKVASMAVPSKQQAQRKDNMNTDRNINHVSAAGINEPEEKSTYTVAEIAEILRIGKSKAYELCDGKNFRIIRIGKAIRVCKASFDAWFNN